MAGTTEILQFLRAHHISSNFRFYRTNIYKRH